MSWEIYFLTDLHALYLRSTGDLFYKGWAPSELEKMDTLESFSCFVWSENSLEEYLQWGHKICINNYIVIKHTISRWQRAHHLCYESLWTCSNPRHSWVTYFILSNFCNFSQLVLSILSTHPLFVLSNFVTLSIFRRLIKLLSSSRPLLSIHVLRYHLTL